MAWRLGLCSIVVTLLTSVAQITHAQAPASPASPAPGAASGPAKLGPFTPWPQMAMYVVLDDEPATVHVTARAREGGIPENVLLRGYDADEKETFWLHREYGVLAADPLPKAGEVLAEGEWTLQGRGIHQVRVGVGARNVGVTVEFSRPLPWGVSFQNGDFKPWPGQPRSMYFYIPPHAEELWGITGKDVRVFDENGNEARYPVPEQRPFSIPILKTQVVWRMDFPEGDWKFRTRFFPLILCPTPAAAAAIKASIEVLPDGTVVAHKFQRRIAELLPKLLAPDKIGRAQDLLQAVEKSRAALVQNPLRNRTLISKAAFLAGVRPALLEQNIDPTSHFSGATSEWKAVEGLQPPLNRWDRYINNPKWYAGPAGQPAYAEALARAALTKDPANPYYGKKELLYRAVAGCLRDLMMLNEYEGWPENANDPYPGFPAFQAGQKTFPVYAVAAQHLPADMPPEARELWTEGLKHIVDRTCTDNLVECRNQSSHHLVAFQDFADGSGLPRYQEVARALTRRFCAGRAGFVRSLGMSPAGYPPENCGPDAGYADMSHWHMATAYRKSGDPLLLEALRKSYNFFNHTVAPEPDGRIIGATNFNHRTGNWFGYGGGFWGGARGIVDDVLPEVGLWTRVGELSLGIFSPVQFTDPAARSKAEARATQEIDKALATFADNSIEFGTFINKMPRWEYWTDKPNRTAVWPAEEKQDFARLFGDEYLAVKRQSYFAGVYFGRPAPDPFLKNRVEFQKPDPADHEGKAIHYRHTTPFVGGGLSLFWTPKYGSVIVALNGSAYCHHGLVAITADGAKLFWEQYNATTFQWDAPNAELRVSGRVEEVPLAYTRTYRFRDTGIEIELTLKALKDVNLQSLVENIPLAAGAAKSAGSSIILGSTPAATDAVGDSVRVENQSHQGLQIRLATPQKLHVGANGRTFAQLKINRVEIQLPAQWREGQTATLAYTLQAREGR